MATGLKAYVAVFLFRDNRVLLLRRSEDRRFAPGLWTGVGGRVALDEMADLEGAALREVLEETGLAAGDVSDLKIQVVLTQPEGGDVALLVFCTARTDRADVGPCDEGSLHWVEVNRVGELALIENAGRALGLAIRAMSEGATGIRFGVCASDGEGRLRAVTFAPSAYGLA